MGEATRIRRNSFLALAASVIRMVATMLMFVGIARFFGPESFGQFALAHTYLTLFYVLADFGIDILLASQVAFRRAETDEFVRRFFPLKVMLSVVATVGMCFLALSTSHETRMLMLLLSLGIIGNAATTFVFALLKGHEQFSFEAVTSFWQHLLFLVGLLALGIFGASLSAVAFLFVASRFFGFFLVLPKAQKHLDLKSLKLSFGQWREPFREALPYGLLMVFGMLYLQLDTILISVFRTDYEVGMYQAAMKIGMLVLALPDVLSTAVLPTLSRYFHENTDEWKRLARLLAKTSLYVGLPCGLIFFLYPDQLLSFVYGGHKFAQARAVLQILGVTLVVRLGMDVYGVFLTTTGRQSRRTAITIGVTLCNLLLNIYVIPRRGIEGAAAVGLVTNLLAGVLYAFSVDPKLLTPPDLRRWTAVMCTLVFGGVLMLAGVRSLAIGVAIAIPFFALVFWNVGYSVEERSLVFAVPKRFT